MRYSMIAALVGSLLMACTKGQEIPAEKMAKVTVSILKDNKLKVTDSTDFGSFKEEELEPYVKSEGISARDFIFTSKLYDSDKEKRDAFGEAFGRIMMEELMKAMSDTGMVNQMMKE